MDSKFLKLAQDYLIVDDKKLLDIEVLLKRHPKEMVIKFLEDLLSEKIEMLRDLIILDKTNNVLDLTIAEWFRITMALNIIREEVIYEESKAQQRTEGCIGGT